MLTEYLNPFGKDVIILTANQRLSTSLRKQYDKEQQAAGLNTWHSLEFCSLNQWILRNVDAITISSVILTEHQELLLWEKIISESLNELSANILLHPSAIAPTASEAWHSLQQWQVSETVLEKENAEEIQIFAHWSKQFRRQCEQQQWLDKSTSINKLINHIETNNIKIPSHIILTGFEEVSPLIETLFRTLAKHTQIHQYHPETSGGSVKCIGAAHEEAEITLMAQWALQQHKENPNNSIACVVPQLTSITDKITRIFTDVFTKDTTTQSIPINISGGMAFAQFPIIHCALQILQLATTPCTIEHISQLLRSPFIGGSEQELLERSHLDIQLRNIGEYHFGHESLRYFSQKNPDCPIWNKQLKQYIAGLNNALKPPSAWAKYFMQQLQTLNWPGERSLNSAEYQQVQRWQQLLNEFAQLDFLFTAELDLAQALHHLLQISQRTLFQPRSLDTPIQILGILEAVGTQFDRCWVMGMNDDIWPQAPSPNPFIPINLQRKLKMPHSSAEREFAFSDKITQRFCKSAEQVIFSYSQQKDDTPLRPSPLIAFSQEQEPKIRLMSLTSLLSRDREMILENITDNTSPPVSQNESIRGGSSILKDQAACPFRAFAKARLNAHTFPSITAGLSAQERGIYLHEILEKIWGVLENHETLCHYQPEALATLIKTQVAQTLNNKKLTRPLLKNQLFFQIEKQRLQHLINEWLTIEKQRPPFTVFAREAMRKIQLGGLDLQLRVDREDKLLDGRHIVIDYKTGNPSINDWFGERPDDPQLPLYCLTSAQPIEGLLFAVIRADGSKYKGISANDCGISGIITIDQQRQDETIKNWQDFQTKQREFLTNLARDFQTGIATVDPKEPGKTCEYCDLQALCRIHESARIADD